MMCSRWVAFISLFATFSFSESLLASQQSRDEFIDGVVGRYAHYDIVAYDQKIPMGNMRTLIVSYGFTDLTKKNGELVATESFCHAEQLSNKPFTSDMSDDATSRIVPKPTPVKIENKNGKWGFFRPETPTPIGVKLNDWVNDPFPTNADDPRFQDDDKDGKPGVTVKIRAYWIFPIEIYIARREIFSYRVTLQDQGVLRGNVYDRSEQIIIGSNPKFVKVPNTPFIQNKDLSKSPIILKPVAQTYDCKRLMQERRSLFPPNPRP